MLKIFMAALGGPSKIASDLAEMSGRRVEINSVYQWPHRGKVPVRWCFYVGKLAKKKKIKNVPAEVREFMQ